MKQYAIITSEFNREVTSALHEGAVTHLHSQGVSQDKIASFWVPGAIEIPLTAKLLAKKHKYAAIICLGAVIRGETDHYHYVCEQVSLGCQQVMLEYDIPIIFGILTTLNEAQAFARAGGAEGNKGKDAAEAALRMSRLLEQLTTH